MPSESSRILTDEHKNILKAIEELEKEADSLENGGEIDEKFFERIIYFIRNYADKFHHAKEEDILFKEICKNENMHCNPTEQMLHEHELGRGFVKSIEEGIKKRDIGKIIENSINYSNLLKEHIFKEDNILYPMADETLDEKTNKEIAKKFRDIENKRKIEKKKCLDILKKIIGRNK